MSNSILRYLSVFFLFLCPLYLEAKMNFRECLLLLGIDLQSKVAPVAASEFEQNANKYKEQIRGMYHGEMAAAMGASAMEGVIAEEYRGPNYRTEANLAPIKIGKAESLWDIINNRDGNYTAEQKELVRQINNARLPAPQLAAHLISDHCVNIENLEGFRTNLAQRAKDKKRKTTLIATSNLPGGSKRNTPLRIVSEVVTAIKNLENPLDYVDDSTSKDQLILNVPVTFYSESSTRKQGTKSTVTFRVRMDRNGTTKQLQPIQIYPVYDSTAAYQDSNYPLYVYRGDLQNPDLNNPRAWEDNRPLRLRP